MLRDYVWDRVVGQPQLWNDVSKMLWVVWYERKHVDGSGRGRHGDIGWVDD